MVYMQIKAFLAFFYLFFAAIQCCFSHDLAPKSGQDLRTLLSDKEQAWLAEKHVVRVRVADFPPNHFWEDGPKGVSVDLLKRFAQMFEFKVEFVKGGETWAEALSDIRSHKNFDVLPATIHISEREGYLHFSKNYLRIPQVIFARRGSQVVSEISDLFGQKVAMPRMYSNQLKLIELFPELSPFWVDSPLDALQAVKKGDALAFIGGESVGKYHIKKLGLETIGVAGRSGLPDIELAFAVRYDWPELASIIDKGVGLISFEERDAIRSKYITVTQEVKAFDYRLFLWGLLWVLFIIIVIVIWNWTLRVKINLRTRQLSEVNQKLEEKVFQRTAELFNSKSRLEALFENIPNAFTEHEVELDEKGKITDCFFVSVNAAFLDLLLIDGNVLGKSVKEITPEFGLHWIALYNNILEKGGKPIVFEYYAKTRARHLRVYAFMSSEGRFATLFADVTERTMFAQELIASQSNLAEAQRIAKIGNWEFDIGSGEVEWSKGCALVYGRKPSANKVNIELFYELVHHDDREKVRAEVKQQILDCEQRKFEHRIVLPDGEVRHVLQRCEVIPDEHGVPIRIFGIVQDVTAWRNVEDKLRYSARLQEKIISASSYLLSGKSETRDISAALKYLLEGLGASRVYVFENFVNEKGELGTIYTYEACGENVRPEINNPICKQILYKTGYQRWRELLSAGHIVSGPVNTFPKEERPALEMQGIQSLAVVPIEVQGEWLGFIGFDQNDYERIWHTSEKQILKMSASIIGNYLARLKVEKSVQESSTRLDMAIQAGNLGLWDWNFETDEVFTNEIWETMLGYEKHTLGQKLDKFLSLLHPDDMPEVRYALYRHLTGEKPLYKVEFRMCCSNGVYKWIMASGKIIERSDNGEPLRMIGIHFDISELRSLQQDLISAKETAEEANRSKSEFLANMSHEIRTPLNAVMGMTKLINDTELSEKQRSYLDTIDSSARSLLNIINDILDFSKIEAGKLGMEKIEFSLLTVSKNLTNMFVHVAEEKHISFKMNVAENVPEVLIGDPLRLKQVLINLVNNAMKFTEEGGVYIESTCSELDETHVELRFDIADTGIGIDKKKSDSLFESFSQADSSTTRKYGGTGLGLSICKRLVEMMDGEISFESEVGIGTTFTFTTRFMIGCHSSETMEPDHSLTPDQLKGRSILLAEDSEINQMIVKEFLESKGIQVSCVNNGLEAVEAAVTGKFDLILMDIHMPELDGYAAARRIQDVQGNLVPIVALTANAMLEDVEKSKQAGMTAHVTKPIDMEELVVVISKLINIAPSGFDMNRALSNLGGKKDLLKELASQFFRKYSDALNEIRMALDHEDYERIADKAHSVKGVAGNLGAFELSETAALIEKAAKEQAEEKLMMLLKSFRQVFKKLKDEMLSHGLIDGDVAKSHSENNYREVFSRLSQSILLELKAALESGDSCLFGKLVEKISEIDSTSGKIVKRLAEDYEYNCILENINCLLKGDI